MLSCPEKLKISAYIDGELSESEISQIESHLNACEKCAKVAAGFRGIHSLVLDDGIEANADFKAESLKNLKIKMRFSRSTQFERKSEGYRFPLATAAAILLVFAPLYSLVMQNSRNLPPEFYRQAEQFGYFSKNPNMMGISYETQKMEFPHPGFSPRSFENAHAQQGFDMRKNRRFHNYRNFQSPMMQINSASGAFMPFVFWQEIPNPQFFQNTEVLPLNLSENKNPNGDFSK